LCAMVVVSSNAYARSWTCVRLSISSAFWRVRLSQNLIIPSLPAVATTWLGASFARSRHVTLSLTFLTVPFTANVAGSRNRNESSDDIMASWSSLEYVRGSCRAAVEMTLYMLELRDLVVTRVAGSWNQCASYVFPVHERGEDGRRKFCSREAQSCSSAISYR
jgi:hypothetical protein